MRDNEFGNAGPAPASPANATRRDHPTGSAGGGSVDPFLLTPPTVSLPKGGGAIRGIGEKFAANPVTGTGSLSLPIALSPGRGGGAPPLSLGYDSGSGQSVFGLGWTLGLPSITRKTDQGLPRYADGEESDVFMLSGADDLVPILDRISGNRLVEDVRLAGHWYKVYRYRPRVEGAFARIERWARVDGCDVTFWRTISSLNVTTWYGRSEESRIFDSEHCHRIYQWLVCQTHDDKGNVVVYRYTGDAELEIDRSQVWESNREPSSHLNNRYLKRVLYGNPPPSYLPQLDAEREDELPSGWMFEAVLDYGEHCGDFPQPAPTAPSDPAYSKVGLVRPDAFSSHRAGFEIRTHRLCRRVLMFHHFAEAPGVGDACLVRSTEFDYASADGSEDPTRPGYTVLRAVRQSSFRRTPPGSSQPYVRQQLPPVEFTYSQPVVGRTARRIDASELDNLPVGTQGPGYRWIDLDGEGLAGVLGQATGAWYYKPGLGNGTFGPVRAVARMPALAAVAGSSHRFIDLAGDGSIDVVEFDGPVPGFHERQHGEGWTRHIPFASLPNIDWQDANLRFLDLTGNGLADALVTEQDAFTWYPSLDERGFATGERRRQAPDEDAGPRVVFAEEMQTIFLADMCGDGLTDLVRIRNGEVCYWPNLGHGQFGRKVTLGNSPCFDHPDQFDPSRIRLADIDGSGPVDLIYLGRKGAQLYFNRSGNSLSDALDVDLPVATANLHAVQVADLLGNGTACLVWNSHLPADAQRPVFYIDLMGGTQHGKPHLLVGVDNNLGGTTEIGYTPSTRFYLKDRQSGTPWLTRLPFPVHCVSAVTVRDKWRRTAFTSTYSYHHGHFDGVEREFRGFGRVEQVDTESYGTFAGANTGSPWVSNDRTLYQPPVKTVTWYHTGAAPDRPDDFDPFEPEYFPQRFAARLTQEAGAFCEKRLPPPQLPADLAGDEWREAHRACKGMVLRQEVYELDVQDLIAATPLHTPVRLYTCATHNCRIELVQARRDNRHAVFLVTESEALSYHHELPMPKDGSALDPDPRVTHTLNLRHDDRGNPQQRVAVGYGRMRPSAYPGLARPDLVAQVQAELHVAYSESRYTQDVVLAAQPAEGSPIRHHRLRLPCESLHYELKGIARAGGCYYGLEDFRICNLSEVYGPDPDAPTPPIEVQFRQYHQVADGSVPQKRLLGHSRSTYFDDDSEASPPIAPLPFGSHGPRGLKFEDYRLALTADLLSAVFRHSDAPDPLADKLAWEAQPAAGDARARTALDLLDEAQISGYWPGSRIGVQSGGYWVRSGTAGFGAAAHQHFYLPSRYTDPFEAETTLRYDPLDLFVAAATDAAGNTTMIDGFDPGTPASVVAGFDYRVLAPLAVRDIHGNAAEVAFDVSGLPAARAVKGKRGEGDSLGTLGTAAESGLDARIAFFTQDFSLNAARALLQDATAREIRYFGEVRAQDGSVRYGVHPPCAAIIARERHVSDLAADEESDLQIAFQYSDGSGNVLMKKVRAEAAVDNAGDSRPARFVVDDFSSGPFNNNYALAGPAETVDSQVQAGTMASGQRYWALLLRGSPGAAAAIDIPGAAGGFQFSSDIGVGHRFDWSYGTTYIRHVPMSLDLHNHNALRLHFLEAPRGLNLNVLLYFRGQADNYAQLGTNIGPQATPFDVDFAFDSFRARIAVPARPADFSQVSGIYVVTQSGGWTAGGGEGFAIGSIAAVALARWIVNGKTIVNNKGKPVKQYEPYFTDSQRYEEPVENGVTPVMYYDAAGRIVRTEFPDGTLSRAEFSPWHARIWDQNDTVLESAWYASRNQYDPASPLPVAAPGTTGVDAEQRAGWLAARHAGTPSLALLDSLGRDVIAVAHNRVEDAAGPYRYGGRQWTDEFHLTFTKLDAEGKPLWVRDARGNLALQSIVPPKATRLADEDNEDIPLDRAHGAYGAPGYDMAGHSLYRHSMDAGDRWTLMDAAGRPMLAWDFNQRQIDDQIVVDEWRLYWTEYDRVHRPARHWLSTWFRAIDTHGSFQFDGREQVERLEYQDGERDDRDNLNGQLVRRYDASGVTETRRRDFSGNVQEIRRTLVSDPTASRTDWSSLDNSDGSSKLEVDTYIHTTEHDALGRMVRQYNWHRDGKPVAVYEPQYNERGLLRSESLRVHAVKTADGYQRSSGELTVAIEDVRYNAKGQKEALKLGNGTMTRYAYDPATYRLRQVFTSRPPDPRFPAYRAQLSDPRVFQQLLYTADPVGNITEVEDQAFKLVYFDADVAEPRCLYEYDCLYRLTWARGRETAQGGAAAGREAEPAYGRGFPVTDQTLRTYTQRYAYDAVGNFVSLQHAVAGDDSSGWTRRYDTDTASNRLLSTRQGAADPVSHGHDTHGNMLNLAAVDTQRLLRWDHRDMIGHIDLGGGGNAWYQYDSGKQRTRKFIRRTESSYEERVYLGGLERYRRVVGDRVVEEIESLHLFEGQQRVLLVDDIQVADAQAQPGPNGLSVAAQTLYRYQYGNHLGTVTAELDQDGRVISFEEFHPFGTTAYRGLDALRSAPARRYRFSGVERDEESNLGYHNARYLCPTLCRWTSADAISDSRWSSAYSYVHGNPIRFSDPLGTYDWDQFTSDVWKGIKGLPRGAMEPFIVVSDLSNMAAKAGNYYLWGITPEEYDRSAQGRLTPLPTNQSSTVKKIEGGQSAARAGLVLASSAATFGAGPMVDSWVTVFEQDMSFEQSASYLTQGTVPLVAAAFVAKGAQSVNAVGEMVSEGAKSGLESYAREVAAQEARPALPAPDAAWPTIGGKPVPPTGKASLFTGKSAEAIPDPAVIGREGFKTRGTNRDLSAHKLGEAGDSQFQGATEQILTPDKEAGAARHAVDVDGAKGWVFKVRTKFWDTNSLLFGRWDKQSPMLGPKWNETPYAGESELTISGDIPGTDIEGWFPVEQVDGKIVIGEFVRNSHYASP